MICEVPAVNVRDALEFSVASKFSEPAVIVEDPKSSTRVLELVEVIVPQVRL